MKKVYPSIISAITGSFFLMLFALYDNFPIVTGDTGAYITSGFSLQAPADRPIFYGLFIRFTSLGMSVWPVIFCQCLLLYYVIQKFIRKLLPAIPYLHILGLILFISLFTIAGWFAGQLMPDIFVPILLLAIGNFLFFPNTGRERIILILIALLATLTHNSNVIVITLLTISVLLLSFVNSGVRPYRKRLYTLLGISICSWMALCTSNWISGNGFVSSKSTHVFVMGKLVESGLLKIYLDKTCPTKNYKICAYKDKLPAVAWEFHWNADSPLQLTGGWDANREEYNAIIKDIFSRPEFYPRILYKAAEATARQLCLFNIDGSYALPWIKFDEESSPYQAVQAHFPHEVNELKTSRQNQKTLNIAFYDGIYVLVLAISLILLLFTADFRKKHYRLIGITIVLFIVLNAFATACLSSVNARFNARVIWILPFISLVLLYKKISHVWMQQCYRK